MNDPQFVMSMYANMGELLKAKATYYMEKSDRLEILLSARNLDLYNANREKESAWKSRNYWMDEAHKHLDPKDDRLGHNDPDRGKDDDDYLYDSWKDKWLEEKNDE